MTRKIVFFSLLCLGLLCLSCRSSTDENFAEKIALSTDSIAIQSESIPLGASVRIESYHTLLNDCEQFYGFSVSGTGFEKEFSAYGFKTDAACGIEEEIQQLLAFTPSEVGTYQLKFRVGETGWIEKTLVVTAPDAP